MDIKASGEITLGFIKDIVDTVTYYKLQDATLDPPNAPTDGTPTGWSETEPAYDGESERKLYSVTKTIFTDGTFSYSEVSLSSSFKAANQALATANQAKTAAENAAKTATNYIKYIDETGLVIGDMTAGTLGANTLIDSEGVAVRNGSTESARFGAHRIAIGSDDNESVVDIRNGTCTISGRLIWPLGYYTAINSKGGFSIERQDPYSAYNPVGNTGILAFGTDSEWQFSPGGEPEDDDGYHHFPPVPPTGVRGNLEKQNASMSAVLRGTTESGESFVKEALIHLEAVARKDMNAWLQPLGTTTVFSKMTLKADTYVIGNPSAFRRALSADKYAAITVQYPAGSHCYCENEALGILYEASDSIGSYEFPIGEDELGTWKITIVDETRTAIKTVTLSEDNRTAHVDIGYRVYIIKAGVLVDGIEFVGNQSDCKVTPSYSYNGEPTYLFSANSTSVVTRVWTRQVAVPVYATALKIHMAAEQRTNGTPNVPYYDVGGNRWTSTLTGTGVEADVTREVNVMNVAGTEQTLSLAFRVAAALHSSSVTDMWFE